MVAQMASKWTVETEVVITRDTKLRHLKYKSWSKVVQVLSVGNRWLEIASKIKRPNGENKLLYSPADISTLENQARRGVSPAEAFLEHWSTTGIKQPTVGDLLDLLVDAQLLHAADEVSEELQVSNASENGTKTDSSIITVVNGAVKKNDAEFSHSEPTIIIENSNHDEKIQDFATSNEQELSNVGQVPLIPRGVVDYAKLDCLTSLKQAFAHSAVLNYSYKYLASITGNFCDISVYKGGFKIGDGGFGVVYRAHSQGQWVAVKRLKEAIDKQFKNELEVLSRFKHENLLPLLGFSDDGPYCCLVYLFMINGSLQERLACAEGTMPLSWKTRIAIAHGTAKGINYLHTFGSEPLVHRDIKSANILLDEKLIAKVGDFGLARIGNSATKSIAMTSNVIGTSVYMAREAFTGEVSVKLDTFSFGVVLLELLTGLPPLDFSREETDLISYMEEKCGTTEDVIDVLDIKAGDWIKECAFSLYEIAKQCLEIRKKDRPTIAQILPDLQMLYKHSSSA